MFKFENYLVVWDLAALNVNASLGTGVTWLVKILPMRADELQSRIAWTVFHKTQLVFL